MTAARERGLPRSGPADPGAPLGILDVPSGRRWEPSTQTPVTALCARVFVWCAAARLGCSPSRRFSAARCVLCARGLRAGVSEDAKRAGERGRGARSAAGHRPNPCRGLYEQQNLSITCRRCTPPSPSVPPALPPQLPPPWGRTPRRPAPSHMLSTPGGLQAAASSRPAPGGTLPHGCCGVERCPGQPGLSAARRWSSCCAGQAGCAGEQSLN